MALEDAVTLGCALAATGDDLAAAFLLYQRSRVACTARVVLMTANGADLSRPRRRAAGAQRPLWQGRSPERFYDALEWLYGWSAEHCLMP